MLGSALSTRMMVCSPHSGPSFVFDFLHPGGGIQLLETVHIYGQGIGLDVGFPPVELYALRAVVHLGFLEDSPAGMKEVLHILVGLEADSIVGAQPRGYG